MSQGQERSGVFLGFAAYFLWGVFPVYFKAVSHVPPTEVLAHRILWSFALLAPFILWRRQLPAFFGALRKPRTMLLLCASTFLILCNWFIFIYAVTKGYVLQSSLGYFINPLVSVLCGFLFFGERLNRRQKTSIALAASGVVVQTWLVGEVPVIALALAFSFGTYGLIRKVVQVDSLVGLTVETGLLAPIALAYMTLMGVESRAIFLSGDAGLDVTLMLSGVVTASPLLLFGAAMKKLPLSTMGIMQYIVPTAHFMLATMVYGEPFTPRHLISFALIWTALIIFSFDMYSSAMKVKRQLKAG